MQAQSTRQEDPWSLGATRTSTRLRRVSRTSLWVTIRTLELPRTRNILNKTTAISRNLSITMNSNSQLMMDTKIMSFTHSPSLTPTRIKLIMEELHRIHMIITIGSRITSSSREPGQKGFFLQGIYNRTPTRIKNSSQSNGVAITVRNLSQSLTRYK